MKIAKLAYFGFNFDLKFDYALFYKMVNKEGRGSTISKNNILKKKLYIKFGFLKWRSVEVLTRLDFYEQYVNCIVSSLDLCWWT